MFKFKEINMAYVYIYYDPRKNPIEPIYIGKGTKENRMYHHLIDCKNIILKRKINKIKKEKLKPIIKKYKDNITNEDAINLEKKIISKYGRLDLKTGSLCNLTDGGEERYFSSEERCRFKFNEESNLSSKKPFLATF